MSLYDIVPSCGGRICREDRGQCSCEFLKCDGCLQWQRVEDLFDGECRSCLDGFLILDADIIAFARAWTVEMEDLQRALDLGQPAPCVDCCDNLAEAKITHGHCECECDDVELHCRQQREADAYWSAYFGLVNPDGSRRSIRESGFTQAVEDGDASSGWRYRLVGAEDV